MHHILFFQEVEKKNNTVEIPFRIKAARKQKSRNQNTKTHVCLNLQSFQQDTCEQNQHHELHKGTLEDNNHIALLLISTTLHLPPSSSSSLPVSTSVVIIFGGFFVIFNSYKLEKQKSKSDLIIFYWNHPPEGIELFCSPVSLCAAVTLGGVTATAPPGFTTGTVVSISGFTLTEINSLFDICRNLFLCVFCLLLNRENTLILQADNEGKLRRLAERRLVL